jgi:WD40 repeat protein
MNEPVKTRRLTPRWSFKAADYITALAWSPDGGRLVASTGSGTMEFFSVDGTRGQERQAHDLTIEALAWTPEGVFTGGHDSRLKQWNDGSPAPLRDIPMGKAWITRTVWSQHPVHAPGDKSFPMLAVVSGKQVSLMDGSGTLLHVISDSKTTVQDACWFPLGSMLLTAGYGGLRVWDTQDGGLLRSYEWPGALWSCTWSPDGRWVTAGSQENAVHIWHAQRGDHMNMSGYPGKVRHQSWSHDSRWLATAGGADVLLWDCSGEGPEGRGGKLCAAHAETITALAFHPRTNHLLSGCQGGRLILWNAEGEDEILGAAVFDHPISCMAWSPVDDRVVVGTADGAIALF